MRERKLRTRPVFLSGSYYPEFTDRVAEHLGVTVDPVKLTHFANTELKAETPEVRGADVFVFQSHGAPVNETFMEQVAIINAAKRASAREVTAVIPYRGYGRADKPDNSHESYMGPLAMRFLAMAGADRILEVDPHAGQSAGFLSDFGIEYTPIPASPAIYEYLAGQMGDDPDVVIVSPDSGRAKLNRRYAEYFDRPRAIIDKLRSGANKTEVMALIGEVAGKRCFVIDDMIDTAGTAVEGAEALMNAGIVGHIAVTDSLRLPTHTPAGLIDQISVAPLVGDAIQAIYHGESVSQRFQGYAR